MTSNPISTVWLVRKPEGLRAERNISRDSTATWRLDLHLDEPFDATKLLASEFDHHDEAGDSATRIEVAPAEQQLIPEVVGQDEKMRQPFRFPCSTHPEETLKLSASL